MQGSALSSRIRTQSSEPVPNDRRGELLQDFFDRCRRELAGEGGADARVPRAARFPERCDGWLNGVSYVLTRARDARRELVLVEGVYDPHRLRAWRRGPRRWQID